MQQGQKNKYHPSCPVPTSRNGGTQKWVPKHVCAGGDFLRAGVFTHWESCLFHRFTFIGITSVLVVFCLAFLGGAVLLFVLFCWLTGFPSFLHMGCTSSSSFPRLSPSSWWAQQWSKKKGRSQCVLSQDYFIVDPSVHLWLQAVRTRTATIVMMSAVIGQKKLLAADIFCGPSSQDLLGRVSPAQEFFFRRSHWLCHWLFSFAWSDFYVETDCVAVFTPFIGLPLVVCLGFTTSRRRTFERTLKLLVFARFVSLVFHAVSLCGQHVLFSRYRCLLSYDRMRTLVTGISNPMAALRRSSSFSCAPSMTWLRKGLSSFDSGKVLTSEDQFFLLICLINSIFGLAIDDERFVSTIWSVRCGSFSWLKGKRPGTRTLAAWSQKTKKQ